MKPSVRDTRLGTLTIEQYPGLSEGMTRKVAGRMHTLAGAHTADIIGRRHRSRRPRRA